MGKNLVALAKGRNTKKVSTPIPPVKKVVVEKIAEKKLTPAEERDIKAKQKVEELLNGISSISIKEEELLEVVDSREINSSNEWLNEQVTLLTEQLEISKNDYSKLFEEFRGLKDSQGGVGNGIMLNDTGNDSALKSSVVKLFQEIQSNLLNMGVNPNTGAPNLVLPPIAFMNRMIMFFSFLEEYKQY